MVMDTSLRCRGAQTLSSVRCVFRAKNRMCCDFLFLSCILVWEGRIPFCNGQHVTPIHVRLLPLRPAAEPFSRFTTDEEFLRALKIILKLFACKDFQLVPHSYPASTKQSLSHRKQ